MKIDESLTCPRCNSHSFSIKREATYVYTYLLETPKTADILEEDEALPFLFNNRERVNNCEYLECSGCRAKYPCDLGEGYPSIQFTILQKAIRSDYENNPGFLG